MGAYKDVEGGPAEDDARYDRDDPVTLRFRG